MDGIKLVRIALLALLGTTYLAPVSARTSDTPIFGVWLGQWSQHSPQQSVTRLPCLKTDKAACTSAFSSASAANAGARHKGRISPELRGADTNSTHRRNVVFKRIKRVQAHKHLAKVSLGNFTRRGSLLIGNRTSLQDLVVSREDTDDGGVPALVPLAELVTEFEPPVAGNDPIPSVAAAGISDIAFAALYDFDDQGAPGESQHNFPEIPGLAGAQATQLAAADVPEPGALALVAGGLLILRMQTRRRLVPHRTA